MKTSTKLITGLLAMLGFSGCDLFQKADMYGTPTPEYGSPYVEFTVKGTVTDDDNNAVDNIRVVLKPYENYNELNDTVYTKNGKYQFERGDAWNWQKIQIIAEDIDGEENFGEFEKQIEELDMAKVDFTNGSAEEIINFQLGKVKDDGEENKVK